MTEMDAEVADDILARVAQDGSMDYSCWPKLLPIVVSRIAKIAHTEFPIPDIPSPQPPARPSSPPFLAPLPSSSDPIDTPLSSQETNNNKENDAPTSAPRPAAASDNVASSPPKAPSPVPDATTEASSHAQQPVLPVPVAEMLNGVTSHLTTNFPDYPPHTIQRLAELVLKPRPQYRSVVGYLNALDRVVHVTSGANLYPLPPAIPDLSGMGGMSNGCGPGSDNGSTASLSAANNIGSDEALGGALLTPIPWLTRRANGDGGDDDGSISDAGSSSPLSASGASDPNTQHEQQQRALAQQHSHITFAQSSVSPQVRKESTEMIEGPNGMGSIETVSISVNGIHSTGMGGGLLGLSQQQQQRGVTQGELLRQEQRAGVVPVSQVAEDNNITAQGYTAAQTTPLGAAAHGEGASATPPTTTAPPADEDIVMGENSDPEEEQQDEEVPHARGPSEIGPEDTGPQNARSSIAMSSTGEVDMSALDVEAAVGRRLQSPPAASNNKPIDDATTAADSKSGSDAAENLVLPSPKREAEDEAEHDNTQKRQRTEDKPDTTTTEEASSSTTEVTNSEESSEVAKEEVAPPVQKEASEDEDMVLVDRPAPASLETASAAGEEEKPKEGESSNQPEPGAEEDQPKSSS
ncbi:hypothetical protein QBC45DRAFT_176537 [Copromyces sp. CBS 386.78]|nr:hypothetical protein QBC45DRAFT_176537 [Copromyces sp. CBS 386.78]